MKRAPLDKSEAARGSATEIIPLVDRINNLHHEIEELSGQIIFKARDAGELLDHARNLVKHGEWRPWLEANFDGSFSTAWRYRRIYKRWDVVSNVSRVNDLSIREALKLARYGYESRGA